MSWPSPDVVLANVLQLGATAFLFLSRPHRWWVTCVAIACAAILARRALGHLAESGAIDGARWVEVRDGLYVFISLMLFAGAVWRWREGRKGWGRP